MMTDSSTTSPIPPVKDLGGGGLVTSVSIAASSSDPAGSVSAGPGIPTSDAGNGNGRNGGAGGGTKRHIGPNWLVWVFPRLMGVLFWIILFEWIYGAEGGLGTTLLTVFGVHALCMSLFVFVFTQESLLIKVAPLFAPNAVFSADPSTSAHSIPCESLARFVRSAGYHATLHVCGILCCLAGLIGIVEYKALSPRPVNFPFYTLYTPHSWLAILFLTIWCAQFALGATIHWAGAGSYRWLMPYHRATGKFVYALGAAVCCLGLQDMQTSDLATSVPPFQDTANFTQSQFDEMGYFPDSKLAQYACALVLLICAQVGGVFVAHVMHDEQVAALKRDERLINAE